jgi:hypothetical protein
MKIRIEHNANACFGSSSQQDVNVVGPAHADFRHVNYVPASLRQQSGG